MNAKPSFQYEQELWEQGYELVIGIDEVGRGAFAGPVVVGAVAFCNESRKWKVENEGNSHLLSTFHSPLSMLQNSGIDDSKRLSSKQREKLEPLIKTHALCWALGIVDVPVINRIGIGKATEMAMRKAVKQLIRESREWRVESGKEKVNSKTNSHAHFPLSTFYSHTTIPFLLIDAFNLSHVPGIGLKNQLAIAKGDQQSISIAAASILAKVYRDKLMCELGNSFASYRWESNKGYGTADHRQAIKTHGSSKHHRAQFVETWMDKGTTDYS